MLMFVVECSRIFVSHSQQRSYAPPKLAVLWRMPTILKTNNWTLRTLTTDQCEWAPPNRVAVYAPDTVLGRPGHAQPKAQPPPPRRARRRISEFEALRRPRRAGALCEVFRNRKEPRAEPREAFANSQFQRCGTARNRERNRQF